MLVLDITRKETKLTEEVEIEKCTALLNRTYGITSSYNIHNLFKSNSRFIVVDYLTSKAFRNCQLESYAGTSVESITEQFKESSDFYVIVHIEIDIKKKLVIHYFYLKDTMLWDTCLPVLRNYIINDILSTL